MDLSLQYLLQVLERRYLFDTHTRLLPGLTFMFYIHFTMKMYNIFYRKRSETPYNWKQLKGYKPRDLDGAMDLVDYYEDNWSSLYAYMIVPAGEIPPVQLELPL